MSAAGHAVVTGGAGFIGSCLVGELLEAGHKVTVIDRIDPAEAPRLTAYLSHPRLRSLRHDLACADTDADLAALMAEADAVYHLAGNTENRSAQAGRHADLHVTVTGTVGLLDAVVRGGAAPAVVLASSQLVYDSEAGAEGPAPLRPRSLFGAGKLAAEGFVSAYAHEFGFRARSCRLSNIIGSSFRRGIVNDFVRRLLDDPRQLHVLGDGSQRRSFLAVEDCARALMSAAQDAALVVDAPVRVFDVSNVDTISALEVAALVADECPHGTPDVTVEGTSTAWRGDVGSVYAPPHALTARGWTPRRGSSEAVRATARALFHECGQGDRR